MNVNESDKNEILSEILKDPLSTLGRALSSPDAEAVLRILTNALMMEEETVKTVVANSKTSKDDYVIATYKQAALAKAQLILRSIKIFHDSTGDAIDE